MEPNTVAEILSEINSWDLTPERARTYVRDYGHEWGATNITEGTYGDPVVWVYSATFAKREDMTAFMAWVKDVDRERPAVKIMMSPTGPLTVAITVSRTD